MSTENSEDSRPKNEDISVLRELFHYCFTRLYYKKEWEKMCKEKDIRTLHWLWEYLDYKGFRILNPLRTMFESFEEMKEMERGMHNEYKEMCISQSTLTFYEFRQSLSTELEKYHRCKNRECLEQPPIKMNLVIGGLPGTLYEGEQFTLAFNIPFREANSARIPNEERVDEVQIVGDSIPVHPKFYSGGQINMGNFFYENNHLSSYDVCRKFKWMVEYIIGELSSATEKAAPLDEHRFLEVMEERTTTQNSIFQEFKLSWDQEYDKKLKTVHPTEHQQFLRMLAPDEEKYVYNLIETEDLHIPSLETNINDSVGRGGFGDVWKGILTIREDGLNMIASSCEVAAKVAITTDSTMDEASRMLKFEAHILTMLNHKNIVRCLGVVEDYSSKLCIVLEMWRTDLDRVISEIPYDMDHVFSWMHQIVEAVEYLHSKGIIHRDLKPANILIRSLDPGFDERSTVAVADMGVSNFSAIDCWTSVGTRAYAAPEIWQNAEQTTAVDVFSIGLVYYELVLAKKRNLNNDTGTERLFRTPEDRPPSFHFDEKIMQMIERCWQHEPVKRPFPYEIIEHLRERWQVLHSLSSSDIVDERRRVLARDRLLYLNRWSDWTNNPQRLKLLMKIKTFSTLPKCSMDNLQFEESALMVSGKFGQWYKAKRKDNIQAIVKLSSGGWYTDEMLLIECALFFSIRKECDKFVKCFGVCKHDLSYGIVLEYSDVGTLYDVLNIVDVSSLLSEQHIISWFTDAIVALDYLQSSLMFHGSLEPQSFLITARGQSLKICDLSTVFTERETPDSHMLPKHKYAAPEIIFDDIPAATSSSDIFLVAIVFSELSSKMSTPALDDDLLRRCTHISPKLRPSALKIRFDSLCEEVRELPSIICVHDKHKTEQRMIDDFHILDKRVDDILDQFVTKEDYVELVTNLGNGHFAEDSSKFQLTRLHHSTLLLIKEDQSKMSLARKCFMFFQLGILESSEDNMTEGLHKIHRICQFEDMRYGLLLDESGEFTLEQVVTGQIPNITVENCCEWFSQAAGAVQYLHGNGYWHSDLQPQHFHCFGSERTVKLVNLFPARPLWQQERIHDGTPPYSAPELYPNNRVYTRRNGHKNGMRYI